MNDNTEDARRAMIPEMPAELAARIEAGERVWTTQEAREEFEFIGFMAPLVVVRRRSDGKTGTLLFADEPRFYHAARYYFGWEEDQ